MILRESNTEKPMVLGIDRTSSYSSTCSDPAMQRIGCLTRKPTTVGAGRERIALERKKQSKVQFPDELHTIVGYVKNRKDLTEEDKDSLYIDAETNVEIRKHAKLTAKYYRLKDTRSIQQLDNCYTAVRALADDAMDNTVQQLEDSDEKELAKIGLRLKFWSRRTKFSGRGLERYCSAMQRDERARFVADTRRSLVCMSSEPTVTEERLANFYCHHTRHQRLLARAMGMADAVAVGNPMS